MILDVHVRSRLVAKLYRERDEYVLRYLPGVAQEDFVSLAMPVREDPWRWPRDLFPFFRQNLPEGYLLNVIREEFGPRSPKAAPHFRGLDAAIAQAGFSGPRKPERSAEVIGRSELLGKR